MNFDSRVAKTGILVLRLDLLSPSHPCSTKGNCISCIIVGPVASNSTVEKKKGFRSKSERSNHLPFVAYDYVWLIKSVLCASGR